MKALTSIVLGMAALVTGCAAESSSVSDTPADKPGNNDRAIFVSASAATTEALNVTTWAIEKSTDERAIITGYDARNGVRSTIATSLGREEGAIDVTTASGKATFHWAKRGEAYVIDRNEVRGLPEAAATVDFARADLGQYVRTGASPAPRATTGSLRPLFETLTCDSPRGDGPDWRPSCNTLIAEEQEAALKLDDPKECPYGRKVCTLDLDGDGKPDPGGNEMCVFENADQGCIENALTKMKNVPSECREQCK